MKSLPNTDALEGYLLLAVATACLCCFSYRNTVVRAARDAPVTVTVTVTAPPPPTSANASLGSGR